MKRLILIGMLAVLCFLTTSDAKAAVVFSENFESYALGTAPYGVFYNGADNNGTTTGAIVAGNGGQAYEISATISGTGWVVYGFAISAAVTGNDVTDLAEYTLEFDVANISGDFDPMDAGGIEFSVVSASNNKGYNYASPTAVPRADGYVHMSVNLADFISDWWNGSDGFDITDSTLNIELRGVQNAASGHPLNQVIAFDNVRLRLGSETEPYDPVVTPDNGDGTVGTLNLLDDTKADVTLHFKAAMDPNLLHEPPYPVNLEVLGHYIYVSNSATDPNLALLDYVEQVHNMDPYLTDPNVAYGPITLNQATTYSWQVEEAFEDPDDPGNPYGAGDPNNTIWGPVWYFTTVSGTPEITVDPKNTVADVSGNASFSVTASVVATEYRWFKVGTPDVKLTDGGIYSGTTTDTLTITGATLTDEGQYYCIAYNGDQDAGGIPSDPSNPAGLWLSRLVGYWKFDGDTTDSVDDEVTGAPTHDGSMKTGDPNYVSETGDSTIFGSGNAMRFYADGQFLLVPDTDFFNFFTDGFTFNFWYKAYAPAPPGNVFMSKFDTNTSGWLFRRFDGADSAGDFIIEGSGGTGYAAIPDNQWNMLTATYDPATHTVRTYANGALSNENVIDLSDQPVTTNQLEIGGEDTFGTDLTGNIAIDELRIYSYPLTTVEIAQNYLAVAGGDWICNDELYDLEYDFDDNCRVDLADFAIFAATWLDNYRIYPD